MTTHPAQLEAYRSKLLELGVDAAVLDDVVAYVDLQVRHATAGATKKLEASVRHAREQRDKALREAVPDAPVLGPILAGLDSAIRAHGPVTQQLKTSAAKRIIANLAGVGAISGANARFE